MPRLRIQYDTVEDFLIDFARELARGGIYIPTVRPFPLDSDVEVTLELPSKDEVNVTGKVVQIHTGEHHGAKVPRGMSIMFDKYEGGDEARLQDFLSQLRSNKYVHSDQIRSEPRYPAIIPVKYEVEATKKVYHGSTLNISRRGALVSGEELPPNGSELILSFRGLEGVSVRTNAVVTFVYDHPPEEKPDSSLACFGCYIYGMREKDIEGWMRLVSVSAKAAGSGEKLVVQVSKPPVPKGGVFELSDD